MDPEATNIPTIPLKCLPTVHTHQFNIGIAVSKSSDKQKQEVISTLLKSLLEELRHCIFFLYTAMTSPDYKARFTLVQCDAHFGALDCLLFFNFLYFPAQQHDALCRCVVTCSAENCRHAACFQRTSHQHCGVNKEHRK